MNFKKCTRCGSFYLSEGDVCPKCSAKDNFEFSTFKSYIEQNGTDNTIEQISLELGIQEKNLSRFLGYEGLEQYAEEFIGQQPENAQGIISEEAQAIVPNESIEKL